MKQKRLTQVNPFSLLNCFIKKVFGAYWFASGTPTYLINMLRKFSVLPTKIGKMYVRASAFDAPTENMHTITPYSTKAATSL